MQNAWLPTARVSLEWLVRVRVTLRRKPSGSGVVVVDRFPVCRTCDLESCTAVLTVYVGIHRFGPYQKRTLDQRAAFPALQTFWSSRSPASPKLATSLKSFSSSANPLVSLQGHVLSPNLSINLTNVWRVSTYERPRSRPSSRLPVSYLPLPSS